MLIFEHVLTFWTLLALLIGCFAADCFDFENAVQSAIYGKVLCARLVVMISVRLVFSFFACNASTRGSGGPDVSSSRATRRLSVAEGGHVVDCILVFIILFIALFARAIHGRFPDAKVVVYKLLPRAAMRHVFAGFVSVVNVVHPRAQRA